MTRAERLSRPTEKQFAVLRAVYPLLAGTREFAINCGDLHYLSCLSTMPTMAYGTWRGYVGRLLRKGYLRMRDRGNARVWALGPMAGLLLEEGLLP